MSDPDVRKAYDHGGMVEVESTFGNIFEKFNANNLFYDIFKDDPHFQKEFGGGFGLFEKRYQDKNNEDGKNVDKIEEEGLGTMFENDPFTSMFQQSFNFNYFSGWFGSK